MLVKVRDKCQGCGQSFRREYLSRRGRCQRCEAIADELLAVKREEAMTATPPPRFILDKAKSIESLDLSSLEAQLSGRRVAPKSVSEVEKEFADAFLETQIDLQRQAAITLGLDPEALRNATNKTVLPRETFEKSQPIPSVEQLRELLEGLPAPVGAPKRTNDRHLGVRKPRRFSFDEA